MPKAIKKLWTIRIAIATASLPHLLVIAQIDSKPVTLALLGSQ